MSNRLDEIEATARLLISREQKASKSYAGLRPTIGEVALHVILAEAQRIGDEARLLPRSIPRFLSDLETSRLSARKIKIPVRGAGHFSFDNFSLSVHAPAGRWYLSAHDSELRPDPHPYRPDAAAALEKDITRVIREKLKGSDPGGWSITVWHRSYCKGWTICARIETFPGQVLEFDHPYLDRAPRNTITRIALREGDRAATLIRHADDIQEAMTAARQAIAQHVGDSAGLQSLTVADIRHDGIYLNATFSAPSPALEMARETIILAWRQNQLHAQELRTKAVRWRARRKAIANGGVRVDPVLLSIMKLNGLGADRFAGILENETGIGAGRGLVGVRDGRIGIYCQLSGNPVVTYDHGIIHAPGLHIAETIATDAAGREVRAFIDDPRLDGLIVQSMRNAPETANRKAGLLIRVKDRSPTLAEAKSQLPPTERNESSRPTKKG